MSAKAVSHMVHDGLSCYANPPLEGVNLVTKTYEVMLSWPIVHITSSDEKQRNKNIPH